MPATLKLTFVDDTLGFAITAATASDEDSVHVYPDRVLPFPVNAPVKVVEHAGSVNDELLALAETVGAGFTYTGVALETADELPLLTVTVTEYVPAFKKVPVVFEVVELVELLDGLNETPVEGDAAHENV